MVIRKFKVYDPRTPEDRSPCVPAGSNCPQLKIVTEHPGDADCTGRAYPKYQQPPIV